MSRRIAFEGIENFRDFGDYAAGERRLRRGVLYRSGHHGRATDADLDRLAGLGLCVIVDLRRTPERTRDPSRRWLGFAGNVIENDIVQETLQEWTEFVLTSNPTPERVRQYMLDYYSKVMFEPRYLDLYSRYFRSLAETDGAVLVHCAGGKDRTGVLCALTHHLAGVSDEDIAADYLLTNDMARIRARLPVVHQMTLEMFGKDVSDETLIAVMRAEAEYLDVALSTMRVRCGSVDGYLEEALGLDSSSRDQLRDRLLA